MAPLDLPEGVVRPGRDLVAAPGVVHEQIESPLLPADALEERLHLRVVGVVAADGDAGAAASGQLLRGVINRAGTSQRRRLAAHAATADVDRRAPLAEHEGDALAATAARARDEHDLPLESLCAHRGNRNDSVRAPARPARSTT